MVHQHTIVSFSIFVLDLFYQFKFLFSWSNVNRFYVSIYRISTWLFSGRSPQFIQYRVNSLIRYAFSVKPSKRSVWKMCLYMYICVALTLLVNKLLSYPPWGVESSVVIYILYHAMKFSSIILWKLLKWIWSLIRHNFSSAQQRCV